jgi:hypothetical protein
LGLHDPQFVLHAEQHAEDVGLERCGKAFRGLLRDGTHRPFGAGVVHRDIKAAKPRDGFIDHVACVFLLAHVGVDEGGFRAERGQFQGECLTGLLAPAGDHDLRAFPGEGDGGRTPDTCQPAGTRRDHVAELRPCQVQPT